MSKMLIDGVMYKLWTPEKEDDLEKVIKEHSKDIFGEDSIYFDKRKISSRLDIKSIPDGFAIDFQLKRLYAVEIELSTHSYDHIISQGNRHIDALNTLETKHKLVENFYDEIKDDPYKELLLGRLIKQDLHSLLTDISENPELVIISDKVSNNIKQAQEALNSRMKTKIIEFKTFEREGVGLGVHAHLFEPPIIEKELRRPPKIPGKITPEREYRIPILEVLLEMGGKGKVKEVLGKVETKMKDKLTKIDYEKLPSGTSVRWKNYAMWERLNMINDGLLMKGSPHGIWEITDKGRKLLEK